MSEVKENIVSDGKKEWDAEKWNMDLGFPYPDVRLWQMGKL